MKKLVLLGLLFPLSTIAQDIHKHNGIHPIDAHVSKMHAPKLDYTISRGENTVLNQVLDQYTTDRVSFQLTNEVHSPAGRHLLYQQYIDGIKVYQSVLKINLDKKGNLLSVIENTFSPLEFEIADPVLSDKSKSREPVYFFDGDKLQSGYLNKFESSPGVWNEKVDLKDGSLAYEKNITMFHQHVDSDTTAKAYVFKPNPIISANTTYGGNYVDNNDQASSFLDAERVMVDIKVDYDNNVFRLQNDYVKIVENSAPTNTPVTSSTPEFLFDRSEQGFEEVNVVYHITHFQEYMQSLGFNNLVDYQLEVDPHGFAGADNSAFNYFPSPSLTFGEGGVDDAEDAQVVLHEYGHAIMHSAAPNTNNGSERNALDEANGDYIASSYSKYVNNYDWHKVFSWDGHNTFWNGRMSISDKHYPDDLELHLYNDAPIWSSTIMQIEENIGRDVSTQILLQSAYSYSSNMTMPQAAQLYIQADSLLNNGDNYAYICHLFKDRGLVTTCNVDRPIFIGIDNKEVESSNKAMLVNSQEFLLGTTPLGIMTPKKNVNYSVYDINGKEVASGTSNNSTIILQPNLFAKGAYVIHLTGTNYDESIKFIR